ncbi:HAD family hydrolase [Alkalicoccobacillus porphyridii]|uniref:Phosphoserine phosphatase n=1 Tax=Alkalicoccobacillus porphyridii TaxID=2597270 RepID=A0A554A074_9BACI|nr:HAD-IA family hydrolase [Alkalicoccobacillus porphyridii]TSB47090.1 HAD-IA family hydrolase [Alkalicoccobacillus porphyridii]
MIKAVFFDLDDTLLWDRKSVEQAFKATCEYAKEQDRRIDVKELEESVRSEAKRLYASFETYEFTQLIGINPFEGLWANFQDHEQSFQKLKELAPGYRFSSWDLGLKQIGIDDEHLAKELSERFPLERRKHPFVYEETFAVLDQLRDEYQLLLITNGSPDLQNIKLELTPELVPYFDHIVISGAYGKGKPDKGIFEHALSLMELDKDEVMMVGDNLMTDILGAERAGIASIWVNRHNQTATDVVPTFEVESLTEVASILESHTNK